MSSVKRQLAKAKKAAKNSQGHDSPGTEFGLAFDPLFHLTGGEGGDYAKLINKSGKYLNKGMSKAAEPTFSLARKLPGREKGEGGEYDRALDTVENKPGSVTGLLIGGYALGGALGGLGGAGAEGAGAAGTSAGGGASSSGGGFMSQMGSMPMGGMGGGQQTQPAADPGMDSGRPTETGTEMADDNSYVGRYGDALRRLTAMDAQNGAFARPQVVGGADAPGITPIRMGGGGRSTRDMFDTEQPAAAPAAAPGMDPSAMMGMFGGMGGGGSMMSGGAGFTGGSGSGMGVEGAMNGGGMMYAARGGFLQPGFTAVGEEGPEVIAQDPSGSAFVIPNDQLPPQVKGAISEQGAMGSEKPTSWKDLAKQMPKDQQNALVKQIEQHGPIREKYAEAATREGEDPKARNKREMALYIAEVALRTISNRATGRYQGNSAGAFADALLDTSNRRGTIARADAATSAKQQEVRRLEDRTDTETRRVEGRTDAETKRKETRDDTEEVREEAREDKANQTAHERAKELKRLEAQLRKLEKNGTNAQIVIDADGNYTLVDKETGAALPVTTESEETTTRGSRGKGTTTTTKKVRKPVKAAEKYNPGGMDQDTLQRAVNDRIKLLQGDRKNRGKSAEELSALATQQVLQEAQALGGAPGASGKVIKFGEMK